MATVSVKGLTVTRMLAIKFPTCWSPYLVQFPCWQFDYLCSTAHIRYTIL